MNIDHVRELLDYVDHSRDKRKEMSLLVQQRPELQKAFFEVMFENKAPKSNRAAWVLEFVISEKPALILPYINEFIYRLQDIILESSIRPMAKICENLTKEYYTASENEIQAKLKPEHLEKIAEACFDWLIGDYKVAPKAYAMTSLFLIGKDISWIHPELKLSIEQQFATSSAAFKARGRHILDRLAKKKARD